jgi:trans-aconitate 2-methyltransferase
MPYEFNGEAYKKSSAHQKEWGNKIISELDLKGDEHILDLGCGDGVLTAELAKFVPDGLVLGIDASQGMIEAARKLSSKNLEFRLQDIDDLDYSEEFDLIISNAALHWVKDHNQLLANCFRSLKPDGSIRFNFAADGNCSHFFRVIRLAIKLPQYSNYFQSFKWPWFMPAVEEYEKLVNGSLFREIKVWGENADRYFPDKESLIKWIDQPSLVPLLEHISGADKQAFRNYVVEKMLEETLQADGRCFETFRRINLSAKK